MHALFKTDSASSISQNRQISSANNAAIDLAPNTTSIEELKSSHYISNIKPEEIKVHYEAIKQLARKELDDTNFENKSLTPNNYHDATIDKIMTVPIEVKIDRDEINTAILYNRLGISFLDVKRIETRMEILNLAQKEIDDDADKGLIRKDQQQTLTKKVEEKLTKLVDEKQSILDRSAGNETEEFFLEQVEEQRSVKL